MFSEAMFGSIYEGATFGNNSELDHITLENAEYANASLAEHAVQSMYEFQLNMTNIDAAAVCEEYMYLKENGVEMIGESAWDTIKGWFEKVREAIIALWKKITSFFKSVFKKIDEFVTNDTVWVKMYENKVSEISGNVSFLHPVKIPMPADTDPDCMALAYDGIGATFGKIQSLEQAEEFINKTAKSKAAAGSKEKSYIRTFTRQLPCGPVDTVEAYKKGMIKHFKKDKERVTSASSAELRVYLEYVSKFYEVKKTLKKSYDKNKKLIDKSLTFVKNYEKSCEKDEKNLPAAKAAVKYINTGLSLLTTTNSLNVQILNSVRTSCKQIIKEAVSSYKKDKKDKDKELDESSILGGLELI